MLLAIQYLENYNKEWGLVSSEEGDSGYDLRAAISEPIILHPGERVVVPNGIKAQLRVRDINTKFKYSLYGNNDIEIQIRPRSGLAAKKGITIVNAPGTVDRSYTGELMTILLNTGKEDLIIEPGDRISQMVVCPIYKPHVVEVARVEETIRGVNGFGSSGVK